VSALRAGAGIGPRAEALVLALAGIAALHLMLIPFAPEASGAKPDLVFLLLAAAVLRRPDRVPLALVLGLGLAGDVLLARPPGLGALGLLLGIEVLRSQAGRFVAGRFALEWLAVALVFAAVIALTEAVLALALLPGAGSFWALRHVAVTAAVYPLVALFVALATGRIGAAR
jgi:rod shape-determining protein MreD